MEYAIKEIARVIGAKTNQLLDDTVSLLLTDSRRLSFPEQSLFFALKTKTNDGHRYIQELYKLRVRNFVVSDMLPEFESMKDANFLIVKIRYELYKAGDSPQEAIQHPRDRHHR